MKVDGSASPSKYQVSPYIVVRHEQESIFIFFVVESQPKNPFHITTPSRAASRESARPGVLLPIVPRGNAGEVIFSPR